MFLKQRRFCLVGQGRSYGDSCLVSDGLLLKSGQRDRFLHFEPQSGILECESGVTLEEIIRVFAPRGYFPAVVPGTRFVSLGGAIANDIHGKNHHVAGTFADHVLEFDLLRSDGQILRCSREANSDWFAATVGGLGLTGFITRVRLKLTRIPSLWIAQGGGSFSRNGRVCNFVRNLILVAVYGGLDRCFFRSEFSRNFYAGTSHGGEQTNTEASKSATNSLFFSELGFEPTFDRAV
ncbi:MAG: FAD-binding oxidoreductase [Calothrix sp. SM1_5_4]|nr:FAD-binding oxidoreductase [Calothrix sp. SM1_5_4]